MFSNAAIVRFVPDQPGKGGMKTGFHTFQTQPLLDTRECTDFHVWLGRWEKDFAATALTAHFPVGTLSWLPLLYSFTRPNIHDIQVAGKTNILVEIFKAGPPYSRVLYDLTKTFPVDPNIYTLTDVQGAIPGECVTIGQRCYYTSGGVYNGSIYEGRDGNGMVYGGQWAPYPIGVGQPSKAPTVNITSSLQTAGSVSTEIAYMGQEYGSIIGPPSHWLTSNSTSSAIATFPQGLPVTISMNYNDQTGVAGTDDFIKVPWGNTVQTAGKVVDSRKGDLVNPGSLTWPLAAGQHVEINVNITDLSRYIGLELHYIDDLAVDRHFTIAYAENVLTQTYFWMAKNAAGAIPATAGTAGGTTAKPWYVTGAQAYMLNACNTLHTDYLNVGTRNLPKWVQNATTAPNPFAVAGQWWFPTTYYGGGVQSWTDVGPSYAYAWYDPTTGHISNVSPVLTLPDKDQYLVNTSLPITNTDIDYPPSVDQHRFSWIVWFRSVVTGGGSALFPLGPLPTYAKIVNISKANPAIITTETPHGLAGGESCWIDDVLGATSANGTGVVVVTSPTTFQIGTDTSGDPVYVADSGRAFFMPATGGFIAFKVTQPPGSPISDYHPDSFLLVSGGLQAPMFTNGRPLDSDGVTESYLTHIGLWDGRTWVTSVNEPDVLHFSCDAVQCPFGVATESFPKSNRLRIPAQDGQINGIKLIGDRLIVLTSRYSYYVAGNNETNYRLLRYSSSMPGVGPRQVTELVSQSAGTDATIVYLGRDSIVYAYSPGQEPVKLSTQIQPDLDSALAASGMYEMSWLHAANIAGRRMVMVGLPPAQSNLPIPTPRPPMLPIGQEPEPDPRLFIYDLEQKVWTESHLASVVPQSVTTMYGVGPLTELATTIVSGAGHLYQWQIPSGTSESSTGSIKTFPTDFDGKKTIKQLNFVRLYTNYTNTAPIQVNVYIDETQKLEMSAIMELDGVLSIFGNFTRPWTVTQPVDGGDTREYVAYPNYAGLAIDGSDGTSILVNNDGTQNPVLSPVQGYRFQIEVTGGGTAPMEIFAIDVCYSLVGENAVTT